MKQLRRMTVAVLALLMPFASAGATAEAPPGPIPPGQEGQRVVSMNLCTDQLALLIARPGQLVSVSRLAARADMAVVSDLVTPEMAINHGLAEEIIRLEPDLVLAGIYTTRATVQLLKRLGTRVEEFTPEASFEDLKANIRRMADLLGNKDRGEALVAAFETELAKTPSRWSAGEAPVVGSYATNTYSAGAGTLENQIVRAAGLRHLGEEMGINGSRRVPLERLLLADPDYVMISPRFVNNPSRAAEILRHPALDLRFPDERRIAADVRYSICGAPFTAEAVTRLRQAVERTEMKPEESSAKP
ncbi:ABC transporter substrate-binding protein [Pannonibacter carbonis]|uniref:ABC transporter substrate-binding protein n=1 Tax=Pannonibacter carbonis TaxID=2067569 RepID=UPI000D0FD69B|nr:ABC transporter substrate-binding protein [Pannonibacter carbonis]